MPFNTLTFALFFIIVLSLHYSSHNWEWRKNVLLVASYVFYAAWNPPFIVLLLFSSVLDWKLAQLIGVSQQLRRRKILLLISLVSNLGLLSYFKYGSFLLDNFTQAAVLLGMHYTAPTWDIILPAGISFYTFQSLSYTIDVYRGHIKSKVSLRDFCLFVSFFPQLVAGPIVRADTFLPQLTVQRTISLNQMAWGICLIIIGVFQKIVLADGIFAQVVDDFYSNPTRFSAADAWVSILFFSGQIFYDFSGYSTCAIGAALCFGFELPDNFRAPLAASGFSDFWRRWHISLSTWLRDYLYIPLGGNRLGKWRTSLNLLLTMLIGGLWHGASWLFVLWGGLHGVYLLIEQQLELKLPKVNNNLMLYAKSLIVLIIVTLTWIPFRATDINNLLQVAQALTNFTVTSQLGVSTICASIALMITIHAWQWKMRCDTLEHWFARLSTATQACLISSCLLGIFLYSGGNQRAFIYFQF